MHKTSKRKNSAFEVKAYQGLRFGYFGVTPRGGEEKQSSGEMRFSLGPESLNWQVALEELTFRSHSDGLNVSFGEWVMHRPVGSSRLRNPA